MAARNFNTSVHRSQLLGRAHGAPRQVERSFWRLLFRTSIMAGVTHILFVALFYKLDVEPLAIINIGSSALYLLICLLMLRLRTRFLALGLFVFEFQAHALIAAYLIGWDSGFHYYALLTIPLITLAYFRDKRMKGVAIFLVIALMVVTLLVFQVLVSGVATRALLNILTMLITLDVFQEDVSGLTLRVSINISSIILTLDVSPPETEIKLVQPLKAPSKFLHPTDPNSETEMIFSLSPPSLKYQASTSPEIETV